MPLHGTDDVRDLNNNDIIFTEAEMEKRRGMYGLGSPVWLYSAHPSDLEKLELDYHKPADDYEDHSDEPSEPPAVDKFRKRRFGISNIIRDYWHSVEACRRRPPSPMAVRLPN